MLENEASQPCADVANTFIYTANPGFHVAVTKSMGQSYLKKKSSSILFPPLFLHSHQCTYRGRIVSVLQITKSRRKGDVHRHS